MVVEREQLLHDVHEIRLRLRRPDAEEPSELGNVVRVAQHFHNLCPRLPGDLEVLLVRRRDVCPLLLGGSGLKKN